MPHFKSGYSFVLTWSKSINSYDVWGKIAILWLWYKTENSIRIEIIRQSHILLLCCTPLLTQHNTNVKCRNIPSWLTRWDVLKHQSRIIEVDPLTCSWLYQMDSAFTTIQFEWCPNWGYSIMRCNNLSTWIIENIVIKLFFQTRFIKFMKSGI